MGKVIIILGPTCTGKTSLAEELCLKYGGEIISADSRQVYRYMDIGTGKLPKNAHVVTHLQDVVLPSQDYSVSHWSRAARGVVRDIHRRKRIPFIVGGTGFYIDVLLGYRQLAGVAPDYKLRKSLEGLSAEELLEKLKKLDPERAKTIDRHNKRRLVRALEVTNYEGTTMNSEECGKAEFLAGGDILVIGLRASNKFLYLRADKWVEIVLKEDALLKETAALVAKGYREARPVQGLIYKTILEYLDQKITYEEMKERIKYDMHRYIRRQLTWFRKSPPNIVWLDISQADYRQKATDMIKSYLDGQG